MIKEKNYIPVLFCPEIHHHHVVTSLLSDPWQRGGVLHIADIVFMTEGRYHISYYLQLYLIWVHVQCFVEGFVSDSMRMILFYV